MNASLMVLGVGGSIEATETTDFERWLPGLDSNQRPTD
jgi:hypothetical protein